MDLNVQPVCKVVANSSSITQLVKRNSSYYGGRIHFTAMSQSVLRAGVDFRASCFCHKVNILQCVFIHTLYVCTAVMICKEWRAKNACAYDFSGLY